MRKIVAITIFVFAVVSAGFKNYSNPIHITGKLERHPLDKKERIFQIIVKGDANIVAKTNTTITGDFELSFTPAKEKYFDFFYVDSKLKADTIFLTSYTQFKSDVLQLTFFTSKKYHVDDDDNVVCPKCGQSGDISSTGNTSSHSGYYYCAKDRIKF
ncbi:MAG TPA: hypothetical protein VI461_00865 [Chitinophagaceae bacterium]|nr:hypothetical protein [Chitinophagaceae bacterium]